MQREKTAGASAGAGAGAGAEPLSNALAERATWILALGGPAGPGVGWCDGCGSRVYTWEEALRHADVCAARLRGVV